MLFLELLEEGIRWQLNQIRYVVLHVRDQRELQVRYLAEVLVLDVAYVEVKRVFDRDEVLCAMDAIGFVKDVDQASEVAAWS